MKAIFFILLFSFTLSLRGQDEISVTKIDESTFVKIINSIRSINKYELDSFSASILELENPTGSTNTIETHEIANYFFIAISEYDEFPKQSLFKVGDFLNPKILDVSKANKLIGVKIEHGYHQSRTTNIIFIKLHNVRLY